MPDVHLLNIYRHHEAHEILYALLRERSTEDDKFVNISHQQLPSWDAHQKYVRSRPYRYWYFIQVGDAIAGTCSLTKRNEVGIVLFREHRGKGYGTQAVAALLEKHKPLKAMPGVRSGSFIANINPRNSASIRLFQKLGFTHLQNTYEL